MPRPPRPRLTRERIFHAALELADELGADALSMRILAKRLGVDPMSIYHHVESKAALLDGVAELLIAEVDLPQGNVPWETWMRTACERYLQVAERHPKAFMILSLRSVAGKEVMAAVDSFARSLDDAGFRREDTWVAIQTIGAVMQGFAMIVASWSLIPDVASEEPTAHEAPDRQQFEVIADLVETYQATEPPDVFRLAIDLMIDGLATRAPRRRPRRPRRT